MPFDVTIFEGQGVERAALDAYLDYLQRHRAYVAEAGEYLGVDFSQRVVHDSTKYSADEFVPYARHFYGDGLDPLGYEMAWLHHQNRNAHHWEYWISRSPDPQPSHIVHKGCLPMPSEYVREMVADWMGASKAISGSWDVRDWYEENKRRIQLHPTSRQLLRRILKEINYGAHFRAQAG